jgi:hypothetical protein
MSTYEWESGTIKIPAKEWTKFRTAIIKASNQLKLNGFELAKALYPKVKKTKPKNQWESALDTVFEAERGSSDDERFDVVRSLLYTYDQEKRKQVLRRPVKSNLGLLPTSKSCSIILGEACITLNNESKSVTWDVSENNHACDSARAHPLGKELFRLLERITWTRGSGGTIIGNDEYNRDSDCAGGGGNYVKSEFSMAASKQRKAAKAASRRQPGYGFYGGGRRW